MSCNLVVSLFETVKNNRNDVRYSNLRDWLYLKNGDTRTYCILSAIAFAAIDKS